MWGALSPLCAKPPPGSDEGKQNNFNNTYLPQGKVRLTQHNFKHSLNKLQNKTKKLNKLLSYLNKKYK